MTHKVGDQVRVISKETAASIKDENGQRRINGVCFNEEMYEQCGSLAEITFAAEDYGYGRGYRLKYIDGPCQDWHFLEGMIELPELQQLRLVTPTNEFNEELL